MSKRAYLCITDGSESKTNDPSAWAIVRPRKRRSRWSNANDDKTYVPGMPTQLPPNLTPAQEKMYILQLQIEDITRRLKTGDLGIPANPEDRRAIRYGTLAFLELHLLDQSAGRFHTRLHLRKVPLT
ncbi:Splicing factor 1 [Echinococcus granulosus]|nr:Splicing factor 1 [Echinococcus granulosus]